MPMERFLLILGLIFVTAALVAGTPAVVMRRRDKVLRRQCTAVAKGRVTGYSSRRQVTGSTFLPVVVYRVSGNEYRVEGPRFASCRVVDVRDEKTVGRTTNIDDPADPPQALTVYEYPDASGGRSVNALERVYPTGTRVEVHYDPDRPSRAYAVRMPDTSSLARTCGFLALVELVAAAVFLAVAWLW